MKLRQMTGFFGSLVLIGSTAAAAPALVFNAKVFDQDSNKQKLLFTYKYESDVRADHSRSDVNTYMDLDGKVVEVETAEFDKDGKLISYKVDQKQIGALGLVEAKGERLNFSYTKDGKTKTSDEKPDGTVIIGPSILPFLQANWDKILKGDTVEARFAVPDRQETVGFEYFKEKGTSIDGKPAVIVKMKPSSFVIAALVDPLHFYIEPDGKKLIEVHGRTQVKRSVDGKFKDLDATTTYDYVVPSPTTTVPAGGNSK